MFTARHSTRSSFRFAITLSLLVALFATSSGLAASKFWDGSSDGNFATAANWVGGVAPVAGDDLVFQTGVTRLLVTNNFSPNRAFNSILFQGSNYFVRGNPILVTNGVNSINPSGANHIDADVDVRGSQAWEASGVLASIDINGDINLNANTLTVRANTGDFFLSGIISGTGNLVKTNVGTLRMDGAGHNTYSGFTRFDGGVLELDKFAIFPSFTNFISIPGDLTIGDGNGLVGTDVLRLLADHQITSTSDVTVKNSGLFDLNGHTNRVGSLTMQGGTVETADGALILGGTLTTLDDANTATINGLLSLGGGSRTFNINSGAPAPDLRINATISSGTSNVFNTAGIIKDGGGSLFLAGTNTYNGTTTINDGQVALLSDQALGAAANIFGPAPTVVNGNGNLFLSGVQVTNEDLTINSANAGGAFNASGASIWTGDILLNTNTFISSSGTLLLNGAISGVGGFTKLSGGSVTLAGTNANTYTGTTTVRDGTLLLDKDTTAVIDGAMSGPLVIGENELPENTDVVRYLRCCQLPDDTDITINTSGLLDLNGFGDNVRNITLNGGDIDTAAGSILPTGDITVNANGNSVAVISGRLSVLSNPIINTVGHASSPDLRIDAQVHGAGSIIKNGVGEMELNASNTFSGALTINAGVVIADDDFALGTAANGTTVNAGAVLFLDFGVDNTSESLALRGSGPAGDGVLQLQGTLDINTNVTLNGNVVINALPGALATINGVISGPYGVTKIGAGRLTLAGSSANTYSGDTFVTAGTLALNKAGVNEAIPHSLQIGDGSTNATVLLLANTQITGPTVTILPTSEFDLNGFSETIGSLNMTGGTVTNFGAGLLTLTGNIDAISSGTEFAGIYSALSLSSGTRSLNVSNGPLLADLVFYGTISGAGAIMKNGGGWVAVYGANTYSGLTTIAEGFYQIANDQALGATNAGTSVQPGAVLVISDSISVTNEALTISAPGLVGYALESISGSNWWSGNITLSSNTVIGTISGSTLNLAGSILGDWGITKAEVGTLVLSGGTTNGFRSMTVQSGTLLLDKTIASGAGMTILNVGDTSGTDLVRWLRSNQLPDPIEINMGGGRLDLDNHIETVGQIWGSLGTIDLGSGTLSVGIGNYSSQYGGTIIGSGNIVKVGAADWNLYGNNPYTGSTIISQGGLLVDGDQHQGPITVNSAGILGGEGIVGNVQVNGAVLLTEFTFSYPSVLTTSNIAFSATSDYYVDINGPNPGHGYPGDGYGQLNVRGTNQLGGASLHVYVDPAFAPYEGEEFVIINNDGADAIQGTFSGLPNNSIVTANNNLKFLIRYSAIFENDVVLTFTNAATHVVSAAVAGGGNGNLIIDPNECNFLNVVITNTAGNVLSNVTGTLVSKTPGVAVTYSTAPYPTVPINGRATNTTPFQITTLPGYICGSIIQLELVVTTLTNGSFTIPFTIPGGGSVGTPVPYSLTVDQAIPDGSTLNSTIGVGGITSAIANVTVSLYLTHPSDQEVHISLIGPDGTTIDLSSDNGGTGDDYGSSCANRTTFSDAAATSITAGTPPFVGTFRPEQALSNFVGKVGSAANGTWTLRISDDNAIGNPGTLHCWTLNLAQAVCGDGRGQCESCPENRTIYGTLGNGSLIQSNRLFRDGEYHFCGMTPSYPGLSGGITNRYFDAYTFENGESNACVSVRLSTAHDFFSATYSNAYNPLNLAQNYKSDAGLSTATIGTRLYSFNVAARERFVVVVHGVNADDTGDYTLEVTGGSCRPVLKINPIGANKVALDWSTAAIGYNLLQTNRLPTPLNPNWVLTAPAPVIFNSRYRVTNTMNPSNAFYELRKP
jgi:autotransporter-associated beta strand protein